VERIVRDAFARASARPRRRVTLVHKTNVLVHAGDLWQRTFSTVASEFPDVTTDYCHVDAAAMFSRLLSREIRMEAIRDQRVDALVDAALQIDAATNLISPFEKAALRDGLKDPQAALRFFGALSALVDAEAPPAAGHFDALAQAVESLPATRGKVFTWPIVTLFPFLASPDRHLFVKPVATRNEAHRLRHDLGYDPAPNWGTYASALSMAGKLKDELSSLGCRDMIDVQSFIYRV
jgi:hypothetical protein